MSDPSTDRTDRQTWRPRAVQRAHDAEPGAADPGEPQEPTSAHHAHWSATVHALNPATDALSAALFGELVAIAERALEDRAEAEAIVDGICRMQAALVTTATRSATSSRREAAKAHLERLVRRAALDALPPLAVERRTRRSVASPSPSETVAPTVDQVHEPALRLRAEEIPPRPLGLRPAGRPAGLAATGPDEDGPTPAQPGGRATAAKVGGRRVSTRQRVGRAALAALLVLGGLGIGYLALEADDVTDLDDHALVPAPLLPEPTPAPVEPAPPAPVAEAPASEGAAEASSLSEALQLEAVEPAAGPLRELAEAGPATSDPVDAGGTGEALASGNLRVFIHFQTGSAAAARASALSNDLAAAAGPQVVALRNVDFAVAVPRIRYFYATDAAAARALADFIGPTNGNGTSWQIQDFTHFRPRPAEGTLEIFLPSAGS